MIELPLPKSYVGKFSAIVATIFLFLTYYLCGYEILNNIYQKQFTAYPNAEDVGCFSLAVNRTVACNSKTTPPDLQVSLQASRFTANFVEQQIIVHLVYTPTGTISPTLASSSVCTPTEMISPTLTSPIIDLVLDVVPLPVSLPAQTVSDPKTWQFLAIRHQTADGLVEGNHIVYENMQPQESRQAVFMVRSAYPSARVAVQINNQELVSSEITLSNWVSFLHSFVHNLLLPPWSNGLLPLLAFVLIWTLESESNRATRIGKIAKPPSNSPFIKKWIKSVWRSVCPLIWASLWGTVFSLGTLGIIISWVWYGFPINGDAPAPSISAIIGLTLACMALFIVWMLLIRWLFNYMPCSRKKSSRRRVPKKRKQKGESHSHPEKPAPGQAPDNQTPSIEPPPGPGDSTPPTGPGIIPTTNASPPPAEAPSISTDDAPPSSDPPPAEDHTPPPAEDALQPELPPSIPQAPDDEEEVQKRLAKINRIREPQQALSALSTLDQEFPQTRVDERLASRMKILDKWCKQLDKDLRIASRIASKEDTFIAWEQYKHIGDCIDFLRSNSRFNLSYPPMDRLNKAHTKFLKDLIKPLNEQADQLEQKQLNDFSCAFEEAQQAKEKYPVELIELSKLKQVIKTILRLQEQQESAEKLAN